MLAAVVSVALMAAPANPVTVKLASPGLNVVNVDSKEGALFSDYFARQLEGRGIQVTTAEEIAAVIGLERQKQLLGCTEDAASCTAEIAGALGVDGVITGTLGKVGSGFTVAIKIVSAKDASALATYSDRLPDEDHVFTWLSTTAEDVADKLLPKTPEPRVTLRQRAWIPTVAAVVLGGAGAVSLAQAGNIHSEITHAQPPAYATEADLTAAISRGRTFEAAGVGLVGVGAAALVGAGAMFAFGGDGAEAADVSATASLTPDGAALGLRGTF